MDEHSFSPMTCYTVGPQQTATSRIYDHHLLYFLAEFLKGTHFLVIPQFFEVLLCDSCFQPRAYIKFSKGSCKISDGRFYLLHSVVPSCTDLNHNFKKILIGCEFSSCCWCLIKFWRLELVSWSTKKNQDFFISANQTVCLSINNFLPPGRTWGV